MPRLIENTLPNPNQIPVNFTDIGDYKASEITGHAKEILDLVPRQIQLTNKIMSERLGLETSSNYGVDIYLVNRSDDPNDHLRNRALRDVGMGADLVDNRTRLILDPAYLEKTETERAAALIRGLGAHEATHDYQSTRFGYEEFIASKSMLEKPFRFESMLEPHDTHILARMAIEGAAIEIQRRISGILPLSNNYYDLRNLHPNPEDFDYLTEENRYQENGLPKGIVYWTKELLETPRTLKFLERGGLTFGSKDRSLSGKMIGWPTYRSALYLFHQAEASNFNGRSGDQVTLVELGQLVKIHPMELMRTVNLLQNANQNDPDYTLIAQTQELLQEKTEEYWSFKQE